MKIDAPTMQQENITLMDKGKPVMFVRWIDPELHQYGRMDVKTQKEVIEKLTADHTILKRPPVKPF